MAGRIYWSQHAPIERRPLELVGSGTDRELGERGIERAHHMARSLSRAARLGTLVDLSETIITSPLKRAMATSEILASHLGFDIIVEPDLRAQHFGDLEGKTKEEVLEDPDLAVHLHSNLPADELFTDTAPGGESVQSAYGRMSGVRNRLLAVDGGNPIVITHGSLLKTLVGSVNERPIEEWGGIIKEFKGRLIDDFNRTLTSIDYLEQPQ